VPFNKFATVLVTDGVCGVLDQKALQGILSQLRLNSISCSFLQMPIGSLRGPVLGHVGFPELFNFIATATFGSFLLENDLDGPKGSDGLNPVQRALLTWNFRKGIAGGQMLMGKSPSPQMVESGGQHFRTKLILIMNNIPRIIPAMFGINAFLGNMKHCWADYWPFD
jgi:hypothetical protein